MCDRRADGGWKVWLEEQGGEVGQGRACQVSSRAQVKVRGTALMGWYFGGGWSALDCWTAAVLLLLPYNQTQSV